MPRVTSPMFRALFLAVFRQTWWAHLGVWIVIIGVLSAVQILISRSDPTSTENTFFGVVVFLIFLVLVAGFVTGERTFSPENKSQLLPFLRSLPIGRGFCWAIWILARLLFSFTALAIPLGTYWIWNEQNIDLDLLVSAANLIVVLGFMYCLLFAAGSVWSQVFRSVSVVYTVGGVLTAAFVLQWFIVGSVVGMLQEPYLSPLGHQPWIPLPGGIANSISDLTIPIWLGFNAIGLLLLLLVSARLFSRSEPKGHQVLVPGALLALGAFATTSLLATVSVGPLTMLLSPAPGWQHQRGDPIWVVQGDLDGDNAVIWERISKLSLYSRLRVLNLHKGQTSKILPMGGLVSGMASQNGEDLILMIHRTSPMDRWGYLRPPIPHLLKRINTRGDILWEFELEGLVGWESTQRGETVLASLVDETARFDLLDESSGSTEEIGSIEGVNMLWFGWNLDTGIVATVQRANQTQEEWWIDSGLSRIGTIPRLENGRPCLLPDMVVKDPRFQSELASRFPLPESLSNRIGGFFVSTDSLCHYSPNTPFVFYLAVDQSGSKGEVWSVDTHNGSWSRAGAIPPILQLEWKERLAQGILPTSPVLGWRLSLAEGLLGWTDWPDESSGGLQDLVLAWKEGSPDATEEEEDAAVGAPTSSKLEARLLSLEPLAYLYDAGLGREVPLGEGVIKNIDCSANPGVDGCLVEMLTGSTSSRYLYFEYVMGSGIPKRIGGPFDSSLRKNSSLIGFSSEREQIRYSRDSPEGRKMFGIGADGSPRTIWTPDRD